MEDEKLIILVEKYVELYDPADKNYANQQRKDNCWVEISIEMKQTGKLAMFIYLLLLLDFI